MNLDASQQQQVKAWIDQGLKLSEIQSKISSELGLSLTYMELRFLLDDLRMQPKDREPAPTSSPLVTKDAGGTAKPGTPPKLGPADPSLENDLPPRPGRVSLTVDQITRPGAVVSGKVNFSDGQTAAWYLDQLGRLGLAPQQQGYKPSQMDIMEFQNELQNELARLGF